MQLSEAIALVEKEVARDRLGATLTFAGVQSAGTSGYARALANWLINARSRLPKRALRQAQGERG